MICTHFFRLTYSVKIESWNDLEFQIFNYLAIGYSKTNLSMSKLVKVSKNQKEKVNKVNDKKQKAAQLTAFLT